jgi:tRNA A37 threonylcarbamoyladenosine dehydratase
MRKNVLARQAAAFGRPFGHKFGSLRIGVVGCSETGSPTGTLLARNGAAELVFIDPDKIGKSNLNGVRGARKADVGSNKAKWLWDYTLGLDIGTQVVVFDCAVDADADAFDALMTCDVVFGCQSTRSAETS